MFESRAVPAYLNKAAPNPFANRRGWYSNIAPTYAGVFLWVVFYLNIAVGTIQYASIGVCLFAISVAGLLAFALYYYAPAVLGMKTGYPLYVIGTSTFGATGGYFVPGLLMGALQAGWLAVNVWASSRFILLGLGMDGRPGSLPFVLIGAFFGYGCALIGIKGIEYVARLSLFLNLVPLAMILVVFFRSAPGMQQHQVVQADNFAAVAGILQMILGFFASAGAAGADFGMNSRNLGDVRVGGLVGISLAILFTAGIALVSVAGARQVFGITAYEYDATIMGMGGAVASGMFFLFALASIVPACVSSFIMANSFATMIPGTSKMSSGLAGASIAVLLGVTGIAGDVIGVFNVIGASFAPVCGAIAADYLLSGCRWAGPRRGINLAGYASWVMGFLVGIIPLLPVNSEIKQMVQPVVLYSFFVGFLVYAVLAKAGIEPETLNEFATDRGQDGSARSAGMN